MAEPCVSPSAASWCNDAPEPQCGIWIWGADCSRDCLQVPAESACSAAAAAPEHPMLQACKAIPCVTGFQMVVTLWILCVSQKEEKNILGDVSCLSMAFCQLITLLYAVKYTHNAIRNVGRNLHLFPLVHAYLMADTNQIQSSHGTWQ